MMTSRDRGDEALIVLMLSSRTGEIAIAIELFGAGGGPDLVVIHGARYTPQTKYKEDNYGFDCVFQTNVVYHRKV